MKTKEIGIGYEKEIMLGIARVGWLTTRQAGAWALPEATERCARTSAQRVLSRLTKRGYLLVRTTMLGAKAYVLTTPGAQYCNELEGELVCRPGYDLSQLDLGRQNLIVTALLIHKNAGRTVIGPAGIRAGGFVQGNVDADTISGADGLVFDPESSEWTALVVVRNDNPGHLKRALRILSAVNKIELLGDPLIVKKIKKKLAKNDFFERIKTVLPFNTLVT